MADTVGLVYVGPHAEVDVDDPLTGQRQTVERGETVHVPASLAGRAPSGDDPEADGYDYGDGLLAQPGNWQPATSRKKTVREAKAAHDEQADVASDEGN